MTRILFLRVFSFLVIWQGAATAFGQPAQPGDGSPATEEPVSPIRGVVLQENPLVLEDVGLSLSIPVGAEAVPGPAGGQIRSQISDQARSWALNIQVPRTTQFEMSPAMFADQIVQRLIEQYAIFGVEKKGDGPFRPEEWVDRSDAKLISRISDFAVDGLPAERLSFTVPDRQAQKEFARCYTIVHPLPASSLFSNS